MVREEGLLRRCQRRGRYFKSIEFGRAEEVELLTVNGVPIKIVHSFRYLGRVLQTQDNDEDALKNQFRKAIIQWRNLNKVLSTRTRAVELGQ